MPSTTITDPEETERVIPMALSQLGRSVLLGQKITVKLPEGEIMSGYLAGLDDDHWFILQPADGLVRQHLVRRLSCPALEIHTERTFAKEPRRRQMESVIIPLRTWFNRNVFY